jgi:3-O-alpha-D-mannopyranosyl-alpha-D-mannopyranose xylosylphosphotransferase
MTADPGQVERWREALLWTYAVANLGRKALGEEGHWGDTARMELREMFGLMDEYEYEDVMKIEVHKGDRWTLEPERMERVLEQAGWEAPKASEFLFCKSTSGSIYPSATNC